jgi:molybdate transport system ATP-binding protein
MSGSHIDLRVDYGATCVRARTSWNTSVLALFGPSGSGKSTILEAVAGLRPEVQGTITIDGRDFHDHKGVSSVPSSRRRVGWAPQEASLFPHLTVRQNMLFGRPSDGVDRFEDVTDALSLGPLLIRRVEGLSGGERQRVALARAVLRVPSLLLLDEPFAPLDAELRDRVLTFLCSLRDHSDMRMIVVSHDMNAVQALAGHVAVLDAGKVVIEGPPAHVFTEGEALSIAVSIGAENRFSVIVSEDGDGRSVMTEGGTVLVVSDAIIKAERRSLHVGVRAEDVIVAVQEPSGLSARNCIPGRVLGIHVDQEVAYVRMSTNNDEWVARLSMEAVTALDLAAKMPVWVVVKASAIHPLRD